MTFTPKPGQVILVRNSENVDFVERVFVVYDNGLYHCRRNDDVANLVHYTMAKPNYRKPKKPTAGCFEDYGVEAYNAFGKLIGTIAGYSQKHGRTYWLLEDSINTIWRMNDEVFVNV